MPELSPPAAVAAIAERLEQAGFETWCVGGAVRDALLGHPHLDWDLATAATPKQVQRLFRRTVPLGVEFGTVGVLDDGGLMHEVTTFRRDVQTDGRHAVVEFGATIDEDLARRDFTINAIAYSSSQHRLHDPLGGRRDLERRIVQAVGVAEDRMREDRLRALRAIRFAARFDFSIEPSTWQAIVASAPHLGLLSAERVKQELEKTMEQVERPSAALAMWRDCGALASLVPPLAVVSAVTLATLDELPRARAEGHEGRTINRLTALFSELAPLEAERALKALRFSNKTAEWIARVLGGWQRIAPEIESAAADVDAVPDARIRRWVAAAGRLRLDAVFRLEAARVAALQAAEATSIQPTAVAALYRRAAKLAFRDPIELSDLAVNGDDLRAAGVPAGPQMKRVLDALLDAVIDDPTLNTADALLGVVRRMLRPPQQHHLSEEL